MATQSREIYNTGNPGIDRILSRIADRLDILEGLRPDGSGLVNIDTDKDIEHLSSVTGLTITNSSITITDSNGMVISMTDGYIKFTDADGTTIHQIGDD